MSLEDFDHGIVDTVQQWASRLAALNVVAGSGNDGALPLSLPHNETIMSDMITSAPLAEVRDAMVRAAPDLTESGARVLCAQYALETGGGTACHRWNLGNAKHIRGDGHTYCMFSCTEVLAGRVVRFNPPDPQTWFRAFSSLDDGAIDYMCLMRHRFEIAWPAVQAGDPLAFGHALKMAHYYTADEAAYSNALRAWFEKLA